MKKLSLLIFSVIFMSSIVGCTRDHLNAPCPNFGATCHKAPVNSWDVNQ